MAVLSFAFLHYPPLEKGFIPQADSRILVAVLDIMSKHPEEGGRAFLLLFLHKSS